MVFNKLLNFLSIQPLRLFVPPPINFTCSRISAATSSSLRGLVYPNVNDEPGVYVIVNPEKDDEILYIGKGGTIKNNGSFGNQKVQGRILATRVNNLPAHNWYTEIMDKYKIDALGFYILYTPKNISPALLEVTSLNYFWVQNGFLPSENKAL